jgi:hypothetical protein
MPDKRFLLKLKPPGLSFRSIVATTAEIHGDHLALVNSEGKLAALFVLDVVDCWFEEAGGTATDCDVSGQAVG